MSLLDLNLNDVPDQSPVAKGEYELQCVKCEVKDRANGKGKMIYAMFTILGQPDSQPVHEHALLPEGPDDQFRNQRLRRIKDMARAFDCDPSAFDTEAMVGKTGYAILKEEDSEEYGKTNKISRYVFNQA